MQDMKEVLDKTMVDIRCGDTCPGGAVEARHDAVAVAGIDHGDEEPVAVREAVLTIISCGGKACPASAAEVRL